MLNVQMVFSTLFNEDVEYLLAYLRNFLVHNDVGALFVNLRDDIYAQVINKPAFYADDLLIGVRVFYVKADRPRKHWGATIMLAHLDNFKVATSLFEFEYFCTLASNSLFFRSPNMAEILRCMDNPAASEVFHKCGDNAPRLIEHAGPITDAPPDGCRDLRAWFKPCFDLYKKNNIKNSHGNDIEGLVSSRANWRLISDLYNDVVALEKGYDDNPDEPRFCFEEVLPGAVIMELGDRKYAYIAIKLRTRLNWGGKVDFSDLLSDDTYPAQICALKWFDRDMIAPATKAVTDKKIQNNFNLVKEILQENRGLDLLVSYQLLMAAAFEAKKQIGGGRNLFLRSNDSLTAPDRKIIIKTEVDRKRLDVALRDGLLSYLWFEYLPPLSVAFELSVSADASGTACVQWMGSEFSDGVGKRSRFDLGAKIEDREIVAFWYLPLDADLENQPFYVKLSVSQAGIYCSARDLRNSYGYLVINYRGRYMGVSCDNCFGDELFFHFNPSEYAHLPKSEEVDFFLGVPIAFGLSVKMSLNVFPIKR